MKKTSPIPFADWKRKQIAGAVMSAARFFGRLSDKNILRICGLTEWILKVIDKNHPSLEALLDLKGIIQNDPEGTKAFRNILASIEGPFAFSALAGMIKHYAGNRAVPPFTVDDKIAKTALQNPVKVCFTGANNESVFLLSEYNSREDVLVVGKNDRVFDVLEIASFDQDIFELIETAVNNGAVVSVHHQAIKSVKTAKRVFDTAGENRLRIAHPYFYFEPVQKALDLVRDGEIGYLSAFRIRALIGGKGGELQPDLNFKKKPFYHHAFDHLPLATLFCGRMEKVTSYSNPFYKTKGGQALLNVKFKRDRLYALLECTYAPGLVVPSRHYPYDLNLEITGTDGVIWVKHGMARCTSEPPIQVRVGQKAYTVGIESDMNSNWNHVYRNMANDLVNMARGNWAPIINKRDYLSALKARELAPEAEKQKKVLILD